MDTQDLSIKHINSLEQQITGLLKTMRTAKLSHLPVYEQLQMMEQELGKVRRQRFDNSNTEYPGY